MILKYALWIIGCLVFITVSVADAQTGPSLDGPIVAVNPSRHDAIWLYDVANQSYRELRFGPKWHFVWGFSPDGCRLLFTLSDDATRLARLYSARLDGRDRRELVIYNSPDYLDWGVWEPQWSPDGARIVFTMIREKVTPAGNRQREYHIAWVPAEGGEPQFYSNTGREYEPQWSPDGARIVYMSYEQRVAGADVYSTAVPTAEPPPGANPPPPALVNEADLWVVSADGTAKFRLTDFATGSVRAPRWSPDGELIGFIMSPSPNNDTFWMIGAQQGAIPTQLTYNWSLILDLTWSLDGTSIIGATRDFQNIGENRLWQIPLIGNSEASATLYLPNANIINADYPRFSPDGRFLATRSAYDMVIANTSQQTALTLDPRVLGNTPPVWSPFAFAGELACQLQ